MASATLLGIFSIKKGPVTKVGKMVTKSSLYCSASSNAFFSERVLDKK